MPRIILRHVLEKRDREEARELRLPRGEQLPPAEVAPELSGMH